ncbi:MAG: amidohydrolase, partial [Clostridia bacterium]|nr:amidohydrolase [Clostridia bacterium]
MDFKKLANEVQEKVVAFRRDLHMNPEPSLQEFRTTKQIAAALDELGVPYRLIEPTGVIAEVHG